MRILHALLLLRLIAPAGLVAGPAPGGEPQGDGPSVLVPAATAPGQPEDGPGGATYPHARYTANRFGEGNTEYWLLEPAEPKPKSAPVIVFLHGWAALTPNHYGAWIEHLVRRGNIVIWPRYQAALNTPFTSFTPSATTACLDAFAELRTGAHVVPELSHVAYVGHSMGGALAANLAATAAQKGLPAARAVMCVEPGDGTENSPIHMWRADLSAIPAGTLLLVLAGEHDLVVGTAYAKHVFETATSVLPRDKNYVTLLTDRHGFPPLIADHLAPVAYGEIIPAAGLARAFAPLAAAALKPNAFDFYGPWKLFDGLTDAAFFQRNRQFALGNTPQQRFMGQWSDGTPVRELRIREATGP